MPETQEQINERLRKAREAKALKAQQESSDEAPKKKATTPWKPARVLDIPESLKDPRFVYRFVNTLRQGNELKKLDEGWEYDHELARKIAEYRGLNNRTLNDGAPIDSRYTMRELIVMRMPKEMAESRNKYYQDKANRASKEFKQQLQSNIVAESGDERATVYGSHKEERDFIRRE